MVVCVSVIRMRYEKTKKKANRETERETERLREMNKESRNGKEMYIRNNNVSA